MNPPNVSIGLPVFNGEAYLPAAIDSILAQEYTDFELIISDNASQDRTESIGREYAARDRRIRYHRSPVNEGAARNFNRVFEMAGGRYFKWAAHDDLCLPGFLRGCVEVLDREPLAVLAYPKAAYIDAAGKVIGVDTDAMEARQREPHRRLGQILRSLSMAMPVFGLIRSEALRRTRLIDSFIASDFVLLAELSMLGQFWQIPEILFYNRDHPQRSTHAARGNLKTLAWYNPGLKPAARLLHEWLPGWTRWNRLVYEYLRSVGRLGLRPRDRALCYATVLAATYGQGFRNWGGRWKRKLTGAWKPALSGATHGPKAMANPDRSPYARTDPESSAASVRRFDRSQ